MRSIHRDSSGTTGSLVRRGPPHISQKTFVIIIGTSVSAGVVVLVILLVALVWCHVRRRKPKPASEEKGNITQRSPSHSFIQYPPELVGTSSDITSEGPSTPFSPNSISKATPEERYLENAITWPTHVRSKLSQDSGLGGSSLRTSATSQNVGVGHVLSGVTAVNVSLDTTLTDESTKLINSTPPISPSKGSSVLPSVAEKPLPTEPPPGSQPSPVIEPSLSPETERTQSHTSKAVDSEIVTVDNTPKTPSTPNTLVSLPRSETMSMTSTSKARSASNNLVSLPSKTSVPLSAKVYCTYPGLPSSPAALLASSHMTLKQDEIPPVPHNPLTNAAFLDRPPTSSKKSREGLQSKKHSRSFSQPSTPSHIATGQASPKESTEVKSTKYASVAYAQAKALESARSRSRSAQASVRTPRAKGDRTPVDMQSPKPDKELFALLSSRSRTRPRSHSWSTGGHAPEMI